MEAQKIETLRLKVSFWSLEGSFWRYAGFYCGCTAAEKEKKCYFNKCDKARDTAHTQYRLRAIRINTIKKLLSQEIVLTALIWSQNTPALQI
jgi:hypothetical protein